jgi:hypothetical protein
MEISEALSKLGELWPARAARAAWEAVKLPGDVYQGNVQMTPPGLRREDFTDAAPPQAAPGAWFNPAVWQPNSEVIGRSADLAGLLGGGGMPMAERGAAGIFGGRLAKTADLHALQRAEEMTNAGAKPKDIWSTTGWGQGADGKWRFEIPDNNLKVKFGGGEGLSGPGSVIQHDALAQAYPSLGDMAHSIAKQREPRGAFLDEIPAAPDTDRWRAAMHVSAPNLKEARSIAAHELQHGVQQIEGFGRGGDPDMFHQYLPPNVSAAQADQAAYGAYHRLAGEVEARNVQTRLDLSPELRASYGPRITEDVPKKQQIVRGNDGEMPGIGETLSSLANSR